MTTTTAAQVIENAAAPEKREPTQYERFRNYLSTNEFLASIAPLVGGEVQAKVFVRVVLNAVQQTPALLDADRRTLLLACMKAAGDKLMPNGKEAVLNIYNTKVKHPKTGADMWVEAVQYLPMTAGLIKKLFDSGHVSFVDAAAVYEKDSFVWERGDVPRLVHSPYLGDDPGKVVAAYVVVKLTNGEIKREVMPRRDIETVRLTSKAPDGMMWKKFYDQGAIKSVIKRAYKQLPSSVELEQVIAHDNEAIGFTDVGSAVDQFASAPAVSDINAAVTGKPALEHNPGQTIPQETPSETVKQPSETASAGAEAKAGAKTKTKAAEPAPTFAQVQDAINKATTVDALNEAMDLIRAVADPAHQRALNVAAADKRVQLVDE